MILIGNSHEICPSGLRLYDVFMELNQGVLGSRSSLSIPNEVQENAQGMDSYENQQERRANLEESH
ncbi:hypothetical protein N7539_007625 [Penicillium diatomitis]|uniref:Uncharacterized protein n=1 Tax=Penicillium diatomitis TaxID=2819901 RepID=A0A9W9WWC4_9EURO|nr:uncharacterized protein N7539_007625 [Penicillium diatomitis]KAJ5477481.1 hypothetical protein N7539_007625 [Penicillium diatomitis]